MNVDHPEVLGLSLCSGIAGLDEGVKLAVPNLRITTFVEREAACLGVLVSAMEAERMAPAPCFTDVCGFSGTPYRGAIDILTAGFPCQPFSVAGKRRGTEDERHLFPEVSRIINEVRPRLVFLENVPGLIATLTLHHRRDITDYLATIDRAIEEESDARARWYAQNTRDRLYRRLLREHGISALLYVCCELERLDYTVVSGIFSAEELGASQLRKRIFILAVANRPGARRKRTPRSTAQPDGQPLPTARSGDLDRKVGDSPDGDQGTEYASTGGRRAGSVRPDADVGDAAKPGLQERRGATDEPGTVRDEGPTADSADQGFPYWPPGPGDTAAWEYVLERWPELAPAVADAELSGGCGSEQPVPGEYEGGPATTGRRPELADAGGIDADAGGYGTCEACGKQPDSAGVCQCGGPLADGPSERARGLHAGQCGSGTPAAESDGEGEGDELAEAERSRTSLDGELRRDGRIEECLPGRSAGSDETEHALRGLADGDASELADDDISRAQKLRALGGAVIPAVSCLAFSVLATRLKVGEIDPTGQFRLTLFN